MTQDVSAAGSGVDVRAHEPAQATDERRVIVQETDRIHCPELFEYDSVAPMFLVTLCRVSPVKFAGFFIGLMLVAAWAVYAWRRPESIPPLKVDFPAKFRPQEWDPALASIDFQVSMAANLFSPLLQTDVKTQLTSGWARSFYRANAWTLVLQIRTDALLSDGSILTAMDAAQSLKRLAFLQQQSGDVAFYVEQFCHVKHLESLNDPCHGLIAEGQTLTIRSMDPLAILPQLLTNLETAIVPQKALAADGLTLLANPVTSGPYLIAQSGSGQDYLRANLSHYNHHPKMPQEVFLHESTDATPESLAQDFKAGAIDHIAMFSAINGLEFNELEGKVQGSVSVHGSLPMGLGLFLITEQGRSKFNRAERRYLVVRMQAAMAHCLALSKEAATRVPTIVLIPPSSAGALTLDEQVSYEEARRSLDPIVISQTVNIKLGSIDKAFQSCLNQELTDLPREFMSGTSQKPDLNYASYDMSNYEELTFTRSMIALRLLDVGFEKIPDWIRGYVAEQDPQKRMRLLKKAQFRALWTDPAVIPIWNYDVSAMIRKPWTMNFSPLNVYNQISQVRYGI